MKQMSGCISRYSIWFHRILFSILYHSFKVILRVYVFGWHRFFTSGECADQQYSDIQGQAVWLSEYTMFCLHACWYVCVSVRMCAVCVVSMQDRGL